MSKQLDVSYVSIGDLHATIAALQKENAELRAENARLLDDPGANRTGKYSHRSTEARLAALRASPRSGTQRGAILTVIAGAYPRGLADEQIRNRTIFPLASCIARRKELEEGGWVVKGQGRWESPSGNRVSVWMLSPTAAETLGART